MARSRIYKIQSVRWMQIRRQVCVQTHSKTCLMRKNVHRLLSTFHRAMNDRCNYGKFTWVTQPISSETSLPREQVCCEMGNVGTFTWSQTDPTSKSAKSKRTSIRAKIYRMDDFVHGRKSKESSLGFTQEHVHNHQVHFLRIETS